MKHQSENGVVVAKADQGNIHNRAISFVMLVTRLVLTVSIVRLHYVTGHKHVSSYFSKVMSLPDSQSIMSTSVFWRIGKLALTNSLKGMWS